MADIDSAAEQVVKQANAFVESDGGSLRLLGVENGVARVEYRVGRNESCPECVLAPDDLRTFLLEMFARITPYIRDVEIQTQVPADK